MWTNIAVTSIFLILILVDAAPSEGNGTSISTLNPRISEFKTNVLHILEGARIRKKRQLEDSDPLDYKLKFGSANLEDLPYLSDFNLTFWISANEKNRRQVLVGTTGGHILLFKMLDATDKTATTVALSEVEDMAIKARAFTYHDEEWFVVLHYSGKEYYIRMYQRIGRGLERRQKIDLTGFSDMELVAVKGVNYLVVATYRTSMSLGMSYQASVTLYHWAQSQFDAIASRTAYGARSVVCWSLDGSLYIALAQETNDEGNFEVGSPIYLYNSKDENRLVLWEMLATFGPSKIQHFCVAGNHYIVIIGRRDAVIYWWSNGQFLEWQSLMGTAEASDVSVLSLEDGEVAIVIALKEQALFYTLDSSGYYVITLTMSFHGSNLRSLQFMFSGTAYYALALFADLQKHSFWKLTTASHYLPSVPSMDPLQQCLRNIQEVLKERQMELDAIKKDLSRVWLKGGNQNITTKIVVRGNIISNWQSSIKDVIIVRYAKVPDHSMGMVITAFVEMKDSADDMRDGLDGVVFKDKTQPIKGFKYFEAPVIIPSLTMETIVENVNINDVSISRLQNFGLRKSGDQAFSDTTLVSDIYTEGATVASLNGISTDDFLLRHGKQIVMGSLTFSHVYLTSTSVRTVNSIPTENMITTNSPQNIEGFKKFNFLKANSIDVLGETNEVDLSSISKKIATVDNYNEFQGHMTFSSPVTIDGNIFLTGKINKMVDLSKLVHQSVNLDSQQDLTGHFTFNGKQTITGDLLVGGSINGVSLDNLLTLSSNQKIFADISFAAPVNVERDLIVGLVNGVDLSEQVLRKLPTDQVIAGRKTFTKDIFAEFVDMTEYTTLDDVDPSFLVQDIVQHKQGVVKQNHTVFKEVTILGDLILREDFNGLNITDLLASVWLKSKEQTIETPVSANFLHFKNDLGVSTANGLNLGNDIVRSYADEIIEASKTFTFKTVFQKLHTKNGMLNGVNLPSFKTKLETYHNLGTVQGIKTLNSLEVQGDLEVTMLNELDMTLFMKPNAQQNVHGSVEFSNEITSILGNVKLGSISFSLFNGEALQDYFSSAVTLSRHSSPLKNKQFKHLKATNLSIPLGSTISGVSLNEMQVRAVNLNAPQLITAPKSFASDLNFAKLISVASLNGLELSSYLDEIVLTDQVSKLKNKQFLGEVLTTDAFVQGAINGLKVEDIAENVFYKSKDNVVAKHFVFEGDVDVGDLYATELDGIEFKDLIFLQNDEFLGSGWFLSKTYADRDLFVTGLVNGCDLSEISSSLYTNKTNQVVSKNVNVHTILIVGNLMVKNVINTIPIKVLETLVTTSEDQIITSNAVIEASLIVEKLQMTDQADSNFSFIVEDAVRHSIAQDITGQKTFKGSITASVFSGGDVFASKVNGVDLEDLEFTAVWKNGHQEISGEKIFPSLSTNVAVVNGFINGVKLPGDVVRTDVSEHITHPTYFMSDMYVTSELVVHGLVDGVDLNRFINSRVTLSTPQNVSSELTFYDDVVMHDELTIDGTINEIVLDLVAKVKPIHPLQGYKIFIEFFVSGPLTASSVNGYDVAELSRNVLRYNKDDYINGVQIFEKPIHAQGSLYAEWINSIPIRRLTEAFTSMMDNLKSVMEYLKDLSSSLQQKLIHQMSETEEKASKFAYFILHQEIDLGATSRISYGYNLEHPGSQFSHSLVMWTAEKHCVFMEKCCHLEFSYWLQVKKNGIAVADRAVESGRYYPIHDKTITFGNKNFFVWSNTTDIQPKWCGDHQSRMILASSYNGVPNEVFMDIENAAVLSDVKSFKQDYLYAVAGFYYDPKRDEFGNTVVYIYDEQRHWTESQVLPSVGTLSLDIITYTRGYRQDVLLALGTGLNTDPPSYSTVYKWNNNDGAFDIVQNIPSRYITSTLWIQKGRDLLLSLAGVDYWPDKSVDCSDLARGGQIDIYEYKEHLTWIQSIPVGGVVSTASFSLDGDTYLAAASSQHQMIYIFEWRGYAGFVKIQSISTEVRHLSIYNIDEDIYMTVASTSGPSKILKLTRRGQQSQVVKNFDLTLLDQKDEGQKEQKVITGC